MKEQKAIVQFAPNEFLSFTYYKLYGDEIYQDFTINYHNHLPEISALTGYSFEISVWYFDGNANLSFTGGPINIDQGMAAYFLSDENGKFMYEDLYRGIGETYKENTGNDFILKMVDQLVSIINQLLEDDPVITLEMDNE